MDIEKSQNPQVEKIQEKTISALFNFIIDHLDNAT
jgi:hypothetical protein